MPGGSAAWCSPGTRERNVAAQRFDGAHPLRLGACLPRFEVDPLGAELRRAPGLRSAREHVRAPRDLEVDEPGGDDRRLKLRLQQSAGDSPLPEIDVAFGPET